MIKKILSRGLLAALIATLAYFVFLSADLTPVPIEKGGMRADPLDKDTVKGRGVQYKTFDAMGNEIISGTSYKVTQTGERTFQLREGLSIRVNRDGKAYDVRADSFEKKEDGRRIMLAAPGAKILLDAQEGISIETPGPLIHTPDNIIQTEAEAYFRFGEIQGRCKGLRYKPDEFLELQADAWFFAHGSTGDMQITADLITLDNALQTATVYNGVLSNQNEMGLRQTLMARKFILEYTGGQEGRPFRMNHATLWGEPARFVWDEGELVASAFDVCFDPEGQWAEEVVTDEDTRFNMETRDGYDMHGQSGSLTLRTKLGRPHQMVGQDPIHIFARKPGSPSLELFGEKGIETLFLQGRTYSTRIHGMPSFRYADQEGKAGSLEVLHDEHNIIFSEGAELIDTREEVRILGDKILLANWDQEEREIFAFKFVEIRYRENTPDMIQCFGDSLVFRMPDQNVHLEGEKARMIRRGQRVEARLIEMTRVDDELFDLNTEGEVALIGDTDKGPLRVEARKMAYKALEQVLRFENVTRARVPDMGTLSCGHLEAGIKRRGNQTQIEYLSASDDVILEGIVVQGEQRTPMACRADRLDYRPRERVIYFKGEGKDVTFEHPTGKLYGRELTYNLNDGSMRVDSVTHGTTKTTVNLKDHNSKEN